MRRIPVTRNFDHEQPVGYLMLADTVSDAELVETIISWGVVTTDGQVQVRDAALIPRPAEPEAGT